MEKVSVQISFTREEYDQLQKEANQYGLTVPLFIKGEVLKDDVLGKYYQNLIERVNALPSGTKFNIKALFGVEWTMEKGVKLNLGKIFFSRVDNGVVDNVISMGKDSSNIMWYEKK